MAKFDATRNYYADLNIPANASASDIRKSFRRLALECHPDRHPGQEQEWVSKFQQIQAAHEVLGDPQQRAKYDAERKKYRNLNIPTFAPPTTPRSRPPPPSRNAYTTTPNGGQYYRAAPPKPPPQPSQQRPQPSRSYNTYANGPSHSANGKFRAPPTAQKPDPRKDADAPANKFTAWQNMKPAGREQSKTNNANNPNGTPFGRSQSTRTTSSSKKGFDPFVANGADEGQARSAYNSNYERPKAAPVDDDIAEDVPFAEANRVRTPYFSSKSGERTSMFGEGVGRSASVRNSPTHRPGSSADAGFHSDSGHRQRASYNPFVHMYVSSSDEEESTVFTTGRKSRDPPRPKESSNPQQPQWRGPGRENIFANAQQNAQHTKGSSPNPFKSKSEESINLKFSPGEWSGKFEGHPDYFAPKKEGPSKGRMSPVRGRAAQRAGPEKKASSGRSQPPPPVSPFSHAQFSQMPPPPSGPPPLDTRTFPSGSTSEPHTATFAPEVWAGAFSDTSWVLPTQAKETSPRRASTAPKRSNPPRKGSVAPEGSPIVESQSERKPKYQAFAEDIGGDAMDVDSDSPPIGKTKSAPTFTAGAGATTTQAAGTGAGPTGAATTAPSVSADKPPATGLNGLSGLGNVEPFLPATNGGLGLGELKDALPFRSGASADHPQKPATAQKLKHPEIPKAPDVPAKLDQQSMTDYFHRMESYVRQYRIWNNTMLQHFTSRQAELDNHLEYSFIEQTGEKTNKIGFASYLNKMKEDEQVMETWKLGQEMHISAMTQCEEVRRKAMKRQDAQEKDRSAEGAGRPPRRLLDSWKKDIQGAQRAQGTSGASPPSTSVKGGTKRTRPGRLDDIRNGKEQKRFRG